jgi:hypothetical protein
MSRANVPQAFHNRVSRNNNNRRLWFNQNCEGHSNMIDLVSMFSMHGQKRKLNITLRN